MSKLSTSITMFGLHKEVGLYSLKGMCVCVCECVCLVAQSCPTLCDPVDCSLPGPSEHGILQVRKLEWVAIPSSRGSSQPRDQTHVSCISHIGRWVLYH